MHLPSPSEVVDGIEPAVERVIMRRLEPDPRDRPPSALAVLAALPGGDPLAALMEAGEIPSPELVAASGRRGELETRHAFLLAAAVFSEFHSWTCWYSLFRWPRSTRFSSLDSDSYHSPPAPRSSSCLPTPR